MRRGPSCSSIGRTEYGVNKVRNLRRVTTVITFNQEEVKMTKTKTSAVRVPNGKTIVIVDAGWVFLADSVTEEQVYGMPVIRMVGANVIRAWGTTAGLGEIALNGPTKDTVLDFAGQVDVPHGKVLGLIECTY